MSFFIWSFFLFICSLMRCNSLTFTKNKKTQELGYTFHRFSFSQQLPSSVVEDSCVKFASFSCIVRFLDSGLNFLPDYYPRQKSRLCSLKVVEPNFVWEFFLLWWVIRHLTKTDERSYKLSGSIPPFTVIVFFRSYTLLLNF